MMLLILNSVSGIQCVRVLILFRVIHQVPGIDFGVGYSVCARVLDVVSGNTFGAG